MNALDHFLFGIYPYIALSVFLLGSLIRFDRDQYTWKSDSSQLLRAGQLRWGSNLFHLGVLFLFFGHSVGMLTPHFVYEHFISAGDKQLMAMVSGGLFGVLGFIGGRECDAVDRCFQHRGRSAATAAGAAAAASRIALIHDVLLEGVQARRLAGARGVMPIRRLRTSWYGRTT